MTKVIGHTTYPFGNQPQGFTIIEHQETVTIGKHDSLEATHHYWVPDGEDLTDTAAYIEPITDPDANLDADYQLYRKQYHFLSPAAIKQARQQLQLSITETAALLAMTDAIYSALENGDLLQTFDQEIKLRLLQHPERLRAHLDRYQTLLRNRSRTSQLNFNRLRQHLDRLTKPQ